MKFDLDIYNPADDLLDDEVDDFEDAEDSLFDDLSSDIDNIGDISDEDVENYNSDRQIPVDYRHKIDFKLY